ncbi:MAG: VWA domain-containing protein [Pyrinomonadaceae bacterium MAG19_C2-C3]|nr:VWA domain-containing protein [Pyrinomonadaceae bacterium MAG19_C2-C3]
MNRKETDKAKTPATMARAERGAPFEPAVQERLRTLRALTDQRTFIQLARGLSKLPVERSRAALEVSTGIAATNWRLALDFLRAVPEAGRILAADELRLWGEIGRRISLADAEKGTEFFRFGVMDLDAVPERVRPFVFEVCARQMRLSASIAVETLRGARGITRATNNFETKFAEEWLVAVYQTALEVARRSAKHSADFLHATPDAARRLSETGLSEASPGEANDEASRFQVTSEVARASIELARSFAVSAGGIAADWWASLSVTFERLDTSSRLKLIEHTEKFLERGGAAGLAFFTAGGVVMRTVPAAFDEWIELMNTIAASGNAALVAFARLTPAFFEGLARPNADDKRQAELATRALRVTCEVAEVDVESAIACFRSARSALAQTSIENFERWGREGLTAVRPDRTNEKIESRARRSYYALETRASHEALQHDARGLALTEIAHTLQLYIEALTGRTVDVAPLTAIPVESPMGDGRTIHLPAMVAEFEADELNFRLYKVLAAHAAGQIEFGTHEKAQHGEHSLLEAAYTSLAELYAEDSVAALDAFSLSGYIEDVQSGEQALSAEDERRRIIDARRKMPKTADYRTLLKLFPNENLARRIFGTLENGRIDRRLRHAYKGLRRDLDFVRERLAKERPNIARVPVTLVPFELLFQITLCGGASEDAHDFYNQITSELENIVADYLTSPTASVADTLMATSRVYALFQSIVSDTRHQIESDENTPDDGDANDARQPDADAAHREPHSAKPGDTRTDARELFNQWANSTASELEAVDALDTNERFAAMTAPEQPLEAGDAAFLYDEWDRELADYRVAWCRVIEKRVRKGDRSFVELARSRHRGLVSSLRHQFQLLRPEGLRRVHNELDGDDFDLSAVTDYVIDRRAARRTQNGGNRHGQPSERLYTKRLRRERDVAVAFLLDQSSSTARTMGRHPLQPYTNPGRRIIEIEKEGLVLMSEALESVGDAYAIYGFTSEGRRNVRFYVVKDFDERLNDEVERRISGINFQHNTRLGAAIRHAAMRLSQHEARTHLLIVLTDGRPYDHDYGDAAYAREDTREALRSARLSGITPFCITIDRNSEQELKDLYGEVGYTIIDDVMNLPERMPMIYRKLTT